MLKMYGRISINKGYIPKKNVVCREEYIKIVP
jgi:hypothetical protein